MRNYWTLYVLGSGDQWQADTAIPVPNSDLSIKRVSTEYTVELADASEVHVIPEVKRRKEPLVFEWTYIEKTLKDQIEEYIDDSTSIKIVDHNGDSYYGRFTDVESNWIVGDEGKYDISASFKLILALESINV